MKSFPGKFRVKIAERPMLPYGLAR
jgi:hypothetical protein